MVLLERMKNGENVWEVMKEADLSEARKKLEPYFEEGKCTDYNLIQVMFYLYTHETIDYYPVDVYTDVVRDLHEEFSILEPFFLKLLEQFRLLVY